MTGGGEGTLFTIVTGLATCAYGSFLIDGTWRDCRMIADI